MRTASIDPECHIQAVERRHPNGTKDYLPRLGNSIPLSFHLYPSDLVKRSCASYGA